MGLYHPLNTPRAVLRDVGEEGGRDVARPGAVDHRVLHAADPRVVMRLAADVQVGGGRARVTFEVRSALEWRPIGPD